MPRARLARDRKAWKVVLIGDSTVGKTCIAFRFCKDVFRPNPQETAGVDQFYQEVDITLKGKPLKFNIWDTAGQERYRSILPGYYRASSAIVVVYDISAKSSFDNLRYWIQEVKKHIYHQVVYVIAGNKSDLTQKRQVSHADGANFAEEQGALFFETSAKSGENVKALFCKLGEKLIATMSEHHAECPRGSQNVPSSLTGFSLEEEPVPKKKGCALKRCPKVSRGKNN